MRRSFIVSLLVGTILNGINQGPEFLSGEHLEVCKMLLTYIVPFAVASYGSYAAFRSQTVLPVEDNRGRVSVD